MAPAQISAACSSSMNSSRTLQATRNTKHHQVFPISQHDSPVLAAQAESTLQEYVYYGSSHLPGLLGQYEVQVVKAYVNGLNDEHRRRTLMQRLDVVGWTWQSAEYELLRMVKDSRRSKALNMEDA